MPHTGSKTRQGRAGKKCNYRPAVRRKSSRTNGRGNARKLREGWLPILRSASCSPCEIQEFDISARTLPQPPKGRLLGPDDSGESSRNETELESSMSRAELKIRSRLGKLLLLSSNSAVETRDSFSHHRRPFSNIFKLETKYGIYKDKVSVRNYIYMPL